MSYRKLEIWPLARELTISIHRMTLESLPKFEMFEEGSQIRRSSKSIRSNIVEGYGRRNYKYDYLRFLTYALASCDETTDHLETLYETGSLKDEPLFQDLSARLQTLGKKLNLFIQSVEKNHQVFREETAVYSSETATDTAEEDTSSIQYPVSSNPP